MMQHIVRLQIICTDVIYFTQKMVELPQPFTFIPLFFAPKKKQKAKRDSNVSRVDSTDLGITANATNLLNDMF